MAKKSAVVARVITRQRRGLTGRAAHHSEQLAVMALRCGMFERRRYVASL